MIRSTTAAGLPCIGAIILLGVLVVHGQEPVPTPPSPRQPRPVSAARLANAEEARQHLGLTPAYDNLPAIENLKVAVLDYGFDGSTGPRRYLPEDTVVVEHYDPEFVRRFHLGDPDYRKPFVPLNAHGRTMAQIIWAVTGFHPHGPKFYLLNANGPTMLRRAVRYAIENKVDVILFSNTFEGGGNGDGRGPINRVVADALAADIIWINAAGNYGGHVYNGPVNILPSGYLRLGSGNEQTSLRFRNLLDENTVTITLTWNDYREQEYAGTEKDLDLYVEDSSGQVIGSSEKKQVAASSVPGDLSDAAAESRNPRERIVLTDLAADRDHDYLIRVKAKAGTFTPEDRIRVLITSSREGFLDPATGEPKEAIEFLDASRKGEIYPPADNSLVLTVGDTSPDSAVGPTADHRRKPDILLDNSRAAFTNGEMTYGASNAAAYFAGVVTLLKAAEPDLQTRHLLWFAHQDKATRVAADQPGAIDRSSPVDPQASRRGRRLSNLAAALQNSNSPLQIRAPYFGLSVGPRTQASPSSSLRSSQSFYAPMRIRAGGLEFSWPPPAGLDRASPSGRAAAVGAAAPTAKARPPELLRLPHKEAETPPTAAEVSRSIPIWRTPTREHLAEVVHDRGLKE
jgi:hypothetical protein